MLWWAGVSCYLDWLGGALDRLRDATTAPASPVHGMLSPSELAILHHDLLDLARQFGQAAPRLAPSLPGPPA